MASRSPEKQKEYEERRRRKKAVMNEYGLEPERLPDLKEIQAKQQELVETGQKQFEGLGDVEFRGRLKITAEADLYIFNRYVMGFKDLAKLHQEMCDFLQDMTYRQKLLMIPVGCLKTSCATQGMSIHFLIQPASTNLYFQGQLGANTRILIGCESEGQAKKNLSFIKGHLTENKWIAWLWPEVVWANPKKEAPLWSDTQIRIRRTAIYREPTITAIGTDTALMGDHYDVHLLDDIACMAAWQSPPLMERAKNWRRGARSRVHDPRMAIQIGIATYWGEIYDEWQKDPSVQVMLRSLIEGGESIWPERYPMEVIERLRQEDGDVLFSMMRMNKSVRSGFTALNWEQLREYRIIGDSIAFKEADEDSALAEAKKKRGMPAMAFAPRGQMLSKTYTMRTMRKRPDPELVQNLLDKYGKEALIERYGADVVGPLVEKR